MMCMRVRIFHTACFAGKVKVFVGSREMVSGLSYGQVSPYGRVSAGFRNVSVVSEETGEELVTETMPFFAGRQMTLVLCNTMGCLLLVPMEECLCGERREKSCLRAANFSYGEGPFDFMLPEGKQVFPYLTQGRVSSFLPALPGVYDFCFHETEAEETAQTADNLSITWKIAPGVGYTICIIGSSNPQQPLQIKTLEF